MSALSLLHELDDLGVELSLAQGRVRFRANGGALTPELRQSMTRHRDELAMLLDRRTRLRWPPAREPADAGQRSGPLTRAQRDMWAASHFVDDGTYNVYGAVRMRGALDTGAFARAFSDVHGRHPSLRTVFTTTRGAPVQQILDDVRPRLGVEDLSSRQDPLAACLRECAELAGRMLPLDTAPPAEIMLYRLAPADHVVFVRMHHIIADGLSVTLLMDDLARCYNRRLEGKPTEGLACERDMIDYATWEQEQLCYANHAASRRYWRARLPGADISPLPFPPPLGDEALYTGGPVASTIDEVTTAAIRRLAATSKSSPFVIVSAAIALALSRYTGRTDVVVGMPVTRRDREGLGSLVGLLLDTVPVRVDITGAVTFADLIRLTRTGILGAVAHATVPTDFKGGREMPGSTPLNVVIADAGDKLGVCGFAGLVAAEVPVPQMSAKFELNFLVRDDDATLAIDAEFSPRSVSKSAIAAMLAMVSEIIAAGAADPGGRAADLGAKPFGAAGLGAIGVPGREPANDDSLPGRLAAVARARGDAVAISCDGDSLDYRALASRVGTVARGLRAGGVQLGDVVAVSLPRGIDLVVAIIAVMHSGAAVLVAGESWPPGRRAQVMRDASARLDIDSPRRLAELADLGRAAAPCPPVPSAAVGYVIYTSGSTGTPKGVHVTHRNLLSLVDGTAGRFEFGPSDVWTLFHSCAFDVSMYEMFGCLLHGGRLVVVPSWAAWDPEEFTRLLRAEKVTVLSQTPSALALMLPAILARPECASQLRYVLLAGELLDRQLVDRWYTQLGNRTQLINLYGATETTVHSSWAWLAADDRGTAECDAGVPLPGGALHVLHDNGSAVRDRCVGEIFIGGPQVSLGYLGRPRETARRFVPDLFSCVPGSRMYRSGDLGRRNGNRIVVLGRRDTQVKVNGFRIELAEVEAALASQPGVASAAATVSRDSDDPAIVAIVVAAEAERLRVDAVLRGVRAILPRYMVPRSICAVPSLPLNANGKLDRAAVAAACAGQVPSARIVAAPRDETESLLVELYREVLGREPVSTADDFFDLGGDSIRAIRLVGAARDRGLTFTVRDVYAAPAVTELAELAQSCASGPRSPRPPFSLLPAETVDTFPADVEDAYPMTALQSGMIFHQDIAPGSSSYHIVLSYRIHAEMVPDAFLAAIQSITDTQAVLRTSFDLNHVGTPVQRVHGGIRAPVVFEDLRDRTPADAAARVRQVNESEAAARFELARAPLWRLIVLTLPGGDYQLVFTHHHAILDGWSVNAFFEELHARYYAQLRNRSQPPELAQTCAFADYVRLELEAAQDADDEAFWVGRTRSGVALVAPGRTGEPEMRQVRTELPGVLADLRDVASRLGVSVKSLLLAAHIRVVTWLTGSDLAATSLVFACRPEMPGADRVLGLFLNQLPLQVRLGDQSWGELAQELHREELTMMRHRWYPYAAIQRHHGRQPIFDSSFNFTDYHSTRQMLSDSTLEIRDTEELESTHYAFGSNYTVDIRTGELRLIVEYDATALNQETAALAAEAHRRIVMAIIADATAGNRNTVLPGAADLARSLSPSTSAAPVASGPTIARPAAESAVVQATRLEAVVREVWAEVLGAEPAAADSDFFTVGGASLTAMRMVSRLRARYGSLSMRAFMEEPTVAGIARAIREGTPEPVNGQVGFAAAAGHPRRGPLTNAQHQIWQISGRLPDAALFMIPCALRAEGVLDLEALRRALASLVARHEALRTRVETTATGPELIVEPHAELDVPVVDLRSETDPVGSCERLMAADARRPLQLGRPPLMRVVIYRLAERRHVIYLNIHHIISDGWSLSLLLREAVAVYSGSARGTEPVSAVGDGVTATGVTDIPTSLADRQRDYWMSRLAPPWPTLDAAPGSKFAGQGPASLAERLRSASLVRRLGMARVEALRAGAARHGLTDFMVIASGYAAALRSWSGQDDIRIATHLANRARPGLENVVGLLMNTAVLRMRVRPEESVLDLTRHVRCVCMEAYENQELPFEDVLAALEERYPSGDRATPLFEAMLVVQEETPNVHVDTDLTFGAYQPRDIVRAAPVTVTTANFVLGVTPSAGDLILTLLYKPAVTTPQIATAFLGDISSSITSIGDALRSGS